MLLKSSDGVMISVRQYAITVLGLRLVITGIKKTEAFADANCVSGE